MRERDKRERECERGIQGGREREREKERERERGTSEDDGRIHDALRHTGRASQSVCVCGREKVCVRERVCEREIV